MTEATANENAGDDLPAPVSSTRQPTRPQRQEDKRIRITDAAEGVPAYSD